MDLVAIVKLSRKRAFTLIEILLAMMLLVSLIGVVGWNVRSALKVQSYESDVDRFVSLLQRSQDMLLVFNIETEIEVDERQAIISAVGSINKAYENILIQEAGCLCALSSIQFEDAATDKVQSNFTLKFLDSGYEMSKGVLTLYGASDPAYIYLSGYPGPIRRLDHQPDLQSLINDEKAYYEKLSQSTLRHLLNTPESKGAGP